jgi:hypothetical protein
MAAKKTKGGKVGTKGVAAAAAKEKPAAMVIEPEVVGREDSGAGHVGMLVRRAEDLPALERLEASVQRDIQLSQKVDKAGAMVGIKIGLALESAKALLRHGEYEGWIKSRFGDVFSERKAQYFAKLAKAFLRSDQGATLTLPPPRDAGNWLVVADDGSALQMAVGEFVGDCTIGELLDKHGVRPTKTRGGWRPAEWLVKQYQDEHPHLANKVFDVWPKEDQEKFRVWQEKQLEGDDTAARRMAAEGTWHGIRAQLSDHGLGRKSYALLPGDQLEQTRDIIALVYKEINKALKGKED